jgi:uncharacterized membrane protein YfcA
LVFALPAIAGAFVGIVMLHVLFPIRDYDYLTAVILITVLLVSFALIWIKHPSVRQRPVRLVFVALAGFGLILGVVPLTTYYLVAKLYPLMPFVGVSGLLLFLFATYFALLLRRDNTVDNESENAG